VTATVPKRSSAKKDRSTPSQTGGVTESERQKMIIRNIRDEGSADFYRKQMAEAHQGYVNPPSLSGFDLEVRILSSTICDGEIHVMVSFKGEVETPDEIATSKGELQMVRVQAKIGKRESIVDNNQEAV
jgi:hypothetical protein